MHLCGQWSETNCTLRHSVVRSRTRSLRGARNTGSSRPDSGGASHGPIRAPGTDGMARVATVVSVRHAAVCPWAAAISGFPAVNAHSTRGGRVLDRSGRVVVRSLAGDSMAHVRRGVMVAQKKAWLRGRDAKKQVRVGGHGRRGRGFGSGRARSAGVGMAAFSRVAARVLARGRLVHVRLDVRSARPPATTGGLGSRISAFAAHSAATVPFFR